MRVLVQNLQKRDNLGTILYKKYNPNVMLVQEINIHSETKQFMAKNVSKMGFGTAITSEFQISEIKQLQSPHSEFGGLIYKRTTIATIMKKIQMVSFHGYNGQPFKNIKKLIAHIEAVLVKLCSGPVLFAGDFNTWTQDHLDEVTSKLENFGFHLAYSWPYPGREIPLDHVFVRGLRLVNASNVVSRSDHIGALFDLELI